MHELISKLRGKVGLEISEPPQAWEIRAAKEDDLIFQIIVPRDVLEWFVTVREAATDKEVWSDSNEYYATDNETDEELRSFMRHDIERFVDRLLVSTVRLLKSPKSPLTRLEWRAEDGWELVSIQEDLP